MENKNVVLDIIIEFVKGFYSEENSIQLESKKEGHCKLKSCNYLLNQILRQWDIPKENYYVSKAADALWKELASEDDSINNYTYTQKVKFNKDNPVTVDVYKGSEKKGTPTKLSKDDKENNTFKFNSVFHEEHIIPICVVMDKLCELYEEDKLNYENVVNILNKISICKMLKREDRKLNEMNFKKNRPFDVEKILKEQYGHEKVKIEVIKAYKD